MSKPVISEALHCAGWLRHVAAGGDAGSELQLNMLLQTAATQLEYLHALAFPPVSVLPVAPEDLRPGLEAAARWVEARRQAYDDEYGYTDPYTGAFEYGRDEHAQAKQEYSSELSEIADAIRALADRRDV